MLYSMLKKRRGFSTLERETKLKNLLNSTMDRGSEGIKDLKNGAYVRTLNHTFGKSYNGFTMPNITIEQCGMHVHCTHCYALKYVRVHT